MENLDLSKLSPEQVSKIMEIVNEKNDQVEYNPIKEEFLKQNQNIKKSEEYEGIPFDEYYGKPIQDGSNILKTKKPEADKVTYSQLRNIHSYGSVENFMSAVKAVVESKRDIPISEVSDELDIETQNLLNGK